MDRVRRSGLGPERCSAGLRLRRRSGRGSAPEKRDLICASTTDLSKSPTATTAIRSGRYQSR